MSSLLSRVTTQAQALPSRVFLYAREKWGKSSLFAHAPGAVFFMTRGETGLVELIAGGRVPPTAHFPYDETQPPTWATLRQAVAELIEADHPYRSFVVDTCNGAEILCQEHVRRSQFSNSQAKFNSYGKGWDACRVEWLGLLQDLDHLRARRKMSVVLLAHTQVKKFDDPTAEESYDKYRPACQDKLWDLTHKWADVICFGHFQADTYETDAGRVKARPAVRRVLCFNQSPTWDAGNRFGIEGNLDVGDGAERGWRLFAKTLADAKARGAGRQPPPPPPPAPPATATQQPAADPEPEHDAAEPAGVHPGDNGVDEPPPQPAEPPAGAAVVAKILETVVAAGLDWPQVRDGGGVAEACGFAPPKDFKATQLTAAQALRLLEWAKGKKAERDARRRKQPEPAGAA